MKKYGDVLTMMNEFLHSVQDDQAQLRKTAQQGSSDVKDLADSVKEVVKPGAFGAEKNSDVAESVGGTPATSAEAAVAPGDSETPVDEQGTVKTDAGEGSAEVITVKKEEENINTPAEKMARAARLGNTILHIVGAMRQAEERSMPLEKMAAGDPELQQALSAASYEFARGYVDGHRQRQQDVQEVLASGLVKTAAEADALLDAAYEASPESVAPAGALPGEGGPDAAAAELAASLGPQEVAELDELAKELVQQGVTPEELVSAASGEGAAEAAPAEEAAEEAPAEEAVEEKTAAARAGLDKLAEELDAAGVTPEELDAAVQAEAAGAPADEAAAAGVDPAAAQQLDALAEELNSAGVSPEDVMAAAQETEAAPEAAAAGVDPDTAAQLDVLAEEMDQAGVGPEDLVAAAQTMDELQAAGVTPEEVVEAVQEIAAETPAEPVEEQKVAAEKKGLLKDIIRNLNKK